MEVREAVALAERVEGGIPVAELAQRWVDGESPQVLGKKCGETPRSVIRRIKRWMLAGRGDQAYFDLVTDVLVNRIADADERLEAANDAVQIAKYREMARFARMDFERRRAALYGHKQEVKHTGGGPTFQVFLLERPSDGGRVIEGTHVPLLAAGAAGGEEAETIEGELDVVREG